MQTNKWDIPGNTIILPFSGFQRAASRGKISRSQIAKQNKQMFSKLHTAVGNLLANNQKKIKDQGNRIIHYVIASQNQGVLLIAINAITLNLTLKKGNGLQVKSDVHFPLHAGYTGSLINLLVLIFHGKTKIFKV